jgi:NADH dehydrogenase
VSRDARRHRVVVIGSGFGGLAAARALRRAPVEVTVVSRTTYHLFQPLLYQVATGILSEGEVAAPTRAILRDQCNAGVLLGDVVDIDLQERTVVSRASGADTVSRYDSLVVAAGAGQSYFGREHFAEFAPGMKSIDDALELRGRILGAFERAELAALRGEDVTHLLTFVVVGAGPTGVEMAGQVAELARRTLVREFRAIDPRTARVILLDGADQVLPTFRPSMGARTRRELERLGVEVVLGALVVGMDADGIDARWADGRTARIGAATKIWAAGVQASPLGRLLADRSGAHLDRLGRVEVAKDLTLPGHPEVYVVGDLAALDDLPGVAQVAMQGGRHAARAIARRAAGRPATAPAFVYRDKGTMAIIGRFRAVGVVAGVPVSGLAAWLMWLGLHLFYLTEFRNRVTAVVHWCVAFVGTGRAERTTTEQQVVARLAISAGQDADDGRAALGEGDPRDHGVLAP